MNKEEVLAKVPLFADLSPRNRAGLAAICAERTFQAGDYLMKQGEEGVGLFVIATGAVEVRKKAADGSVVVAGRNAAGDVMGELAVIDGAPRTADVVATERTVCLVLASWEFLAFMKAHPVVAVEILPVLVKRFRETQEALGGSSAKG